MQLQTNKSQEAAGEKEREQGEYRVNRGPAAVSGKVERCRTAGSALLCGSVRPRDVWPAIPIHSITIYVLYNAHPTVVYKMNGIIVESCDLFSGLGLNAFAFRSFATPILYCEKDPAVRTILESVIARAILPAASILRDVRSKACIICAHGVNIQGPLDRAP